jgi:hypothetical protein
MLTSDELLAVLSFGHENGESHFHMKKTDAPGQ